MKRLCTVVLAVFASQSILLGAPPVKPGIGDVFVLNAGVGTNEVLCDQTVCETTLGSVVVPAGVYTIFAKLVVSSWTSTSEGFTFCHVYAGATILDATAATTAAAPNQYVPASLQAAASFPSPTTLELRCNNNNNGAFPVIVQTSAQNWQLMATRVATLTLQ